MPPLTKDTTQKNPSGQLPTHTTLSVALDRVKTILDAQVTGKYFWLKVEIAQANFHRSGHIYLELAETVNGKTTAKCKGKIWNRDQYKLRESLGDNFEKVIATGNEILCFCCIDFNIAYGFSVVIKDINLEFNIGKIEQNRKETLERLKKEKLMDLNKEIEIPLVISKIAIIASLHTSGYEDFITNIRKNKYGYRYEIDEFSTSVQGKEAEAEIVNALKKADRKKYDCIVVIRGGGSKIDLDVFNSYEISKQVSTMQSPVFTGIGHETDSTVIDFTANISFKTPTEVSNYILNKSYEFEQSIQNTYGLIMESYTALMEQQKIKLQHCSESICNRAIGTTQLGRGNLNKTVNRLLAHVNAVLQKEKNNTTLLQQETLQITEQIIRQNAEKNDKTTELVVLYAEKILNDQKSFLSNAKIVLSSNNAKTILEKGFCISRVDNKLYQGEKLAKDTIIKLEYDDATIVTKYVKKERKWNLNLFKK